MKETQDIVMELEDEGFVAAGRTIPFPAQPSTTLVPLPQSLAELAKNGLVRTMTVYGRSLEEIGIFDGDKLVCKKAFHKKEVGPNTICVVYIPTTGEVVAKRVKFQENMLVLRSCHGEVPDMYVKPDDVEIRGVVIGLWRSPDNLGRFDRGYDEDIPY